MYPLLYSNSRITSTAILECPPLSIDRLPLTLFLFFLGGQREETLLPNQRQTT